MNWRTWIKEKLDAIAPISSGIFTIDTDDIHGAGSLRGAPKKKPFIIIHVGSEIEELNDGGIPEVTSREGTVWVHDEPGSYDLIDDVLVQVRNQLVGQVSETNGIGCVWQGDSDELADDAYGTITRNASFRLIGKVG